MEYERKENEEPKLDEQSESSALISSLPPDFLFANHRVIWNFFFVVLLFVLRDGVEMKRNVRSLAPVLPWLVLHASP